MKRIIQKNILSLFLVILIPSFSFSNQDFEMSLCGLKGYYSSVRGVLEKKMLLGNKTFGTESFLGPNFFIIYMDPRTALNPSEYSERIWLLTLWTLAQDIAFRNGILDEFKHDPQYETVVLFLKQLFESVEVSSRLLEPQRMNDFINLRNTLGSELRNFLVNINAFKSNHATIERAYGRLGSFAAGLALAASGVNDLIDYFQLAQLVANSVPIWCILEDNVIPLIETIPLSQTNSLLRRAINNYSKALDTYYSTMTDIIMMNVVIEGGAFLLALSAMPMLFNVGATVGTALVPGFGTVIGAIAAVAGRLVIGFSIDQLRQGGEFVLYYDISSRLFTLAFSENDPKIDKTVFLQSYSLYLANEILMNRVLGRGIISGVGSAIPLVETEEKKWSEMFKSILAANNKEVESDLETVAKNIRLLSGNIFTCPTNYYLFLIDVSGSMAGHKLDEVKKSVPQVINDLPTGNNAYAVIVYSGVYGCTPEQMPIILPFTKNPDLVLNTVNSLYASGNTPMLAGLEKAYQYASTIPSNAHCMIVMLADGQQNCPWNLQQIPPLDQIVIKYFDVKTKTNIKLSTIAYTDETSFMNWFGTSDKELNQTMQRLAKEGGGIFIEARGPEVIKGKFREIILEQSMVKEKFTNGSVYFSIFLILLIIFLL